jgi:hypothetical protein
MNPAATSGEPWRKRHRQMLAIAGAVVVLSLALEVVAGQRVAFRFLPHWPLPPSCLSRTLFGVSCPGCGLTRSFIYLAHGDLQASWQAHHLGWLLALAVVLQFPYRLAALLRNQDQPLGRHVPRIFSGTLILLLFVNWLLP